MPVILRPLAFPRLFFTSAVPCGTQLMSMRVWCLLTIPAQIQLHPDSRAAKSACSRDPAATSSISRLLQRSRHWQQARQLAQPKPWAPGIWA